MVVLYNQEIVVTLIPSLKEAEHTNFFERESCLLFFFPKTTSKHFFFWKLKKGQYSRTGDLD